MNSMSNDSNQSSAIPSGPPIVPPDFTHQFILMGIIGSVSIITNAFLFIIIIRRKKLRTPANDILFSMFICGFLFGAVYVLPKWTNIEYIKWPIYCSLSSPIGVFFAFLFNLHQCLVCFDKFLALKWPLTYRIAVNHCKMMTVIVVIWIVAGFAAFSPLIFYRPINDKFCILISRDFNAESTYLKVVYGLVFFVPLILMVLCYTGIIIIVNSRTQMDKYRNIASLDQTFFSITVKTAKQMAVISGVFVVLWLPFIALSLYLVVNVHVVVHQGSWILPMFEAFRFLAFAYPAINPILCGYYVTSIRRAMRHDVVRKLTVGNKKSSEKHSNSANYTNSTGLHLSSQSQAF